ncbi:phage head-tail adapter protein [Catenuloplanes sp. NPDC051500]|uniref:phage head-tail adapter protein n=1 Tax=Catenuloplanes sp. NPDC051500 TaxID=3363959 RepID=UPI00379DCFD4
MSSHQRRRGVTVKVWPTTATTNRRGDEVLTVDMDAPPITVRAAMIPQRSSKAEVPGQQQINVIKMIVPANLPGVDLWSRVEWNGQLWDVAAPPSYHHGTRQTRHWSLDLRERP